MRQSRHALLNSMLEMKATEVRDLISLKKFSEARNAIIPIMSAFQQVGPREKVNSQRSLISQRMLRYVNKVQSYVEFNQAEGKRISNKSVNAMVIAFDDIIDGTKQILSEIETVPDAIEDERDRRTKGSAEPENIEDVKIKLDGYDASRDSLRNELARHGYAMKRAPVIFSTAPLINLSKANKYFSIERFEEMWYVLKGQIVLGMTGGYMRQQYGLKKSLPGHSTKTFITQKERELQMRDQKNPSHGVAGPLFLQMIETLNARYPGRKYIAVSGTSMWEHASWIWVMTSKDYNLLRQCSASPGNLNVKMWALAFSSE